MRVKENSDLESLVPDVLLKAGELMECYGALQVGYKGAAERVARTAAEIVEACGKIGDALIPRP